MVSCFLCKKSFKSNNHLFVHLNIFHSIESISEFRCNEQFCFRSFSNLRSYKNHMNQHENNSQSQTFDIDQGLDTIVNLPTAVHTETQYDHIPNSSNITTYVPLIGIEEFKQILKTNTLLLAAKWYSNKVIPRKEIQVLFDDVEYFNNSFLHVLKNKVINSLKTNSSSDQIKEISAMFDVLLSPFNDIKTEHLRFKAFEEVGVLVKPDMVDVGQRLNDRLVLGRVIFEPKSIEMSDIPLKHMGSTDSLDSGKDSALDSESPLHDGIPRAVAPCKQQPPIAEGRRKRADKYSASSPPPVAAREHHNRSKSADCCGVGGGDEDGSRARTHAKSLSLGDDSFDHKIQLWRKRADSQGSIDRKPLPAVRHQLQQHAADMKGTGGAPDLVMDLPARTSGGGAPPQDPSVVATQEPDSPDMGTAAERFAKQNQCTLKKYSKPLPALPQLANGGGDKPELPPKSTKPPLKAKPQIFKKPVFLASGKACNDGPAPPHHP